MRLGQTNRLVIIAGALAVILAVLAWLQSGQEEVKNGLVSDMALASQRVANLNPEPLELKIAELTEIDREASANATELAAYFTDHHEGVDVSETLYPLAKEYRLNLYIISSTGLGADEFRETENTGLPMTLTLKGEVLDIIDFISRLHETYPRAVINLITLDNETGVVRRSTQENYINNDIDEAAEVTLEVMIYQYEIGGEGG